MVWFGFLATTPVVSLPALSPDIGEGTYARVVVVDGIDSRCTQQCLVALCLGIEAEAIGQRLAILEGGRVQIDAPLDVALCSLCQLEGIVQHGVGILAFLVGCQCITIEGTNDVDLLIGGSPKGGNEF